MVSPDVMNYVMSANSEQDVNMATSILTGTSPIELYAVTKYSFKMEEKAYIRVKSLSRETCYICIVNKSVLN